MAIRTQTILIDDLNGSDATETVHFGLDGTDYEIDLGDQNAARLRQALSEFVGNARKASPRRPMRARGSRRHRRDGGHDPAAIRAWARENGVRVNERGRIPASVVAQYEAATGAK